MNLEPHQIFGHYRILSRLGAGGMGEVWLAEDPRLRRKIALKVLPASLAQNQDLMDRFEREALAASALNHPNILTIYEFGAVSTEAGETHYLASEFIDGETLRDRLRRAPLTLDETLNIAVQITQALAAAHAACIIHRDIKPENVMLREDGIVKILDFGLAKLTDSKPEKLDPEDETRAEFRTMPGTIMGTFSYMSPEQARGQTVDARTDLFSFGVLLHEMLARRQPFTGETINHIIVAILEKEPPPLPPDVPAELQRIVSQALRKNRHERYPTAGEMLADLKQLKRDLDFTTEERRRSAGADGFSDGATISDRNTPPGEDPQTQILGVAAVAATAKENSPSVSQSLKSIAVLPFADLSAGGDNEYFCDGLAEELLNALAKIAELKVAARTSAFAFKGKPTNVGEIGNLLNVKTILEGSVRRSGNRLRINVQLVNVADGYHLWSERYDREMQDIFDLQDEITLTVVDALKLKLFGDEKAAVLKRYTDDAEVHELFLKGRYYAYKYTAEGWQRAIELFEKALEKQPDYAPAYAGIAAARGCLWFFGILPAEQTIPQCKTASLKALGLDGELAEAHLSLAMITFFYDWEWEKAEQEFKQSIALNPNNAEALSYYALFLAFEERFDEAMSVNRRSLKIDPLSPLINMNVGWTFFSAGMLDEALRQAGKMIEIEPEFYGAYWLKGAIHLSLGGYQDAVAELNKAVSLGGHQIVLADLGSAYSLAGQAAAAAAVLEQMLDQRHREYVPAICLARIYSRIGEHDRAIEWLEKAFEERNGEMVFLQGEIAGAADGDALHGLASDPKLIELLRQMKLP